MYEYKKEGPIEEAKLDRLLSWYRGEPAPPIQMDVELHRRCNLHCLPCSRQASEFDMNEDSARKEMPVERWVELVAEARELGVLIWNIEGGGEPMAVSDLLIPVMRAIKHNDVYGIVTTNGTLWTDDFLREVVAMEWDRIHFSLDGPSATEHDFVRGRGRFEQTVRAMERLTHWKHKLDLYAPMLNLNIVINNRNYDKLPEVVEMARRLEVDYIFTEPLINYFAGSERLKLTGEQLRSLANHVRKAKWLCEKYGIDNNFATKDKNLEADLVEKTADMNEVHFKEVEEIEDEFISVLCYKPWTHMAVKYDGRCGHCGLIEEAEDARTKGLREIWSGEWLESIRSGMRSKQLLPHCSRCCPSDVTQRRRLRDRLGRAVR